MQSRWIALVALVVACGDPPPPVAVGTGRLTALVYPDPAKITLLVDGTEVWSTRGEGGAPNGFAAVGSRAVTVEMQFGSFKFTENKNAESWQGIGALGKVTH